MRAPAILSVLVLTIAACAPADTEPPVREPARELQGAVVILLDTVRADHLSSHGYARDTSPFLARLAAEGAEFEQVVSYSPWTLPSLAAMFSGGPSELAFRGRLQRSVVESIRDAGFATGAVTEGGWVSSRFAFDLGFGEWQQEEGAVQLLSPGQQRDPNPPGGIEGTFRRAREWVAAHRDERFFLFVHTYEPHTPYTRATFTEGMPRGRLDDVFRIEDLGRVRSGTWRLDEAESTYLTALYDGGIRESDRHVEEFLGFLETQGLRDRTLIVVTSDHGEELGAHYATHAADHGHALYDDQLLVPLILHDPLESYKVRRVRPQVRTIDVFPTIAEILGAPLGESSAGQSLLPMLRGEETEARIAFGGLVDLGPPRRFVRYLGHKYIEVQGPDTKQPPLDPAPPREQLFDLTADPGEQRNIAAERPELTKKFRQMSFEIVRTGVPESFELPQEIDEETLERLRSLGYLQ